MLTIKCSLAGTLSDDIRLTRERCPVRSWVGTSPSFFFSRLGWVPCFGLPGRGVLRLRILLNLSPRSPRSSVPARRVAVKDRSNPSSHSQETALLRRWPPETFSCKLHLVSVLPQSGDPTLRKDPENRHLPGAPPPALRPRGSSPPASLTRNDVRPPPWGPSRPLARALQR